MPLPPEDPAKLPRDPGLPVTPQRLVDPRTSGHIHSDAIPRARRGVPAVPAAAASGASPCLTTKGAAERAVVGAKVTLSSARSTCRSAADAPSIPRAGAPAHP